MKTILTKLTVFMIVLALAFCFAACSKGDTVENSSDLTSAPSSETELGSLDVASSEPESSVESSSQPASSETTVSKPQQTVSKPSIVGSWKTELDLTEAIKKGLEEQDPTIADIDVDFKINTVFTFKNNGKYTMVLDKADLKASYAELMKESLKAALELSLQGTGMSLEDYFTQTGTTLDLLLEQSVDLNALVDSAELDAEGDYKLEGNKLYTYGETPEEVYDAGKYTEIELSEKTMKFKKIVGYEEDEADYLVPLTLTKA